MAQYSSLARASLSYDYLHTNSTTHEFLFGALAELLDNARDAQATKINIYSMPDKSLRGGYMLCFLDDGEGMSPEETSDIVTFGKSVKKSTESTMIGMYGNGLKSGSMRIGNDLMVFTKKGPTMSCIFLSRTFHEEEEIDEIIVPMPSFDTITKKPMAKTAKEKERHNIEMALILKYSPFKTESAFFREFDRIDGTKGSLIVVYNMKLLDYGEPELDIKTDNHDILLSNPDTGDFDSDEGRLIQPRLMPERKSFRAYASILYVDPRMRIYIQGKKVQTKRLASCLFKPRQYKYSSSRFKARSENEVKKAKDDAAQADHRAKEVESKSRNLENKIGTAGTRDQRAELRKMQTLAAELRKGAQIKKQMADRKSRALKDPKTLNMIFGVNLDSRNQDGMFVYNCSRLIKMYQKVGPQADGGVFCSGVIGIVDVPYLVLEPTHNKQDFADAKEYRHLQKAMGEHMVQYWKDCGIAQQGVTKFWESFGYISPNWRDPPSTDIKYVRKRAMTVQATLQCDLCLKWRILPYSSNNVGKAFPDDWVCSMNPDSSHNRCSAAEQKMNIQEGILKKETKSQEQKAKELEDEIKKKTETLEKMNKTKPVLSSREAKEIEDQKMSPRGRRVMSQESESEEEEEPEEEDDEEIEEPPSRSRKPVIRQHPKPKPKSRQVISRQQATSKPRHTPPAPRAPKRIVRRDSTSEEEVSEEELPTPAKQPKVVNNKNASRQAVASSADSQEDSEMETENQISEKETTSVISSKEGVGTRVEAKINNEWTPGTVVEVNRTNQRWKVKLDKFPSDKHDKWYEKDGSQIRLLKESAAAMVAESTVSTANNADATVETPSSSTVTPAATGNFNDDIANGYRTCLRYFLPPQWNMDKDSVTTLTIQELAQFPLDDFFDHYEKGLRKLVSSFQLDAQNKQQEAEQAKAKLSSVRKMISKLLKSINEEFEIDPECDTEQVDELLALCVRQATNQQGEEEAA